MNRCICIVALWLAFAAGLSSTATAQSPSAAHDDEGDSETGESATPAEEPVEGGAAAEGSTEGDEEDARGTEALEESGDPNEGPEANGENQVGVQATLPRAGATVRYHPVTAPERDSGFKLILPPLLLERTKSARTTAVFPFYFDSVRGDDHQLLIGPYYRRRSPRANVDVAFPLFWRFHLGDHRTWVVPPFYYHNGPQAFDLGVAPLFFTGRAKDKRYTVIPPLLTAAWSDAHSAHTFSLLFWRVRRERNVDFGVFPFLWTFNSEVRRTILAPPLFFQFEDKEKHRTLTIVPPFYHRSTPKGASYGVVPLFFHGHTQERTSLTIPPLLFHYSHDRDAMRLVTPLFGYFDVEGDKTLVTPLYQRYRGRTHFDSVAPFFFSYRDPAEHASTLVVPPLLWHHETPAKSSTVVLPAFGYWHERGRYTTWATPLAARWKSHVSDASALWIFPTFQFSHTATSSTFNLHPLVYSTSAKRNRHLVLAPLYWDFESYRSRSRTTILFPLLWRFRSGNSVSQLAGNVYYHSGRSHGVPNWEFHVIPFFAYGEPRPGDHFWTVLYGLAGYRRQGRYARASAFWVPFQVDGPASK